MRKFQILLTFLSFFTFSVVSFASTYTNEIDDPLLFNYLSTFINRANVVLPEIARPTPIELILDSKTKEIGVFQKRTKALVRSISLENLNISEHAKVVESTRFTVGSATNLTDFDKKSYVQFELGPYEQNTRILLRSDKEIDTNQLSLVFLENNMKPESIEVIAKSSGKWIKVLDKTTLASDTVNFNQVRSNEWRITFWHKAPIRIAELTINPISSSTNYKVRFIALPGEEYMVYFNKDRESEYFSIPKASEELATLSEITSINIISNVELVPFYKKADMDSDGVFDDADNCPFVNNSNQADLDENGIGDICDDDDKDLILNYQDNCPHDANFDQKDSDDDGFGDLCSVKVKSNSDLFLDKFLGSLPWFSTLLCILLIFAVFILVMIDKSYAQKKNNKTIEKMDSTYIVHSGQWGNNKLKTSNEKKRIRNSKK